VREVKERCQLKVLESRRKEKQTLMARREGRVFREEEEKGDGYPKGKGKERQRNP